MQELASLPHYYKMTQHPPILSFPGWCQRKPSRESLPGDKLQPAPPTPSVSVETMSGSLDLPSTPTAVLRSPLTLLLGEEARRGLVGSQDFYHHPAVRRPPLPWPRGKQQQGTSIHLSQRGVSRSLVRHQNALPHSSKEA